MKPFHGAAIVATIACSAFATPVGADVQPWKPAGISSPQLESHAAFDPRTGEFYFVRSTPDFSGWRIFVSRCTETGWSAPQAPTLAGDGVEADPYFTADGRSLYFISTRSVDGVKQTDLDIWRTDRDDAGAWSAPTRLPDPVNSPKTEWFPRPGAVFSPSGRSLLFARDTQGPDSGEFFVWYECGPEAWPSDCPSGSQ